MVMDVEKQWLLRSLAMEAFYEGYRMGQQQATGPTMYYAGSDPHRHSTALRKFEDAIEITDKLYDPTI